MAQQALYQRVIESRNFSTQAEAKEWGDTQKNNYKEAGQPVKVDVIPSDATRRRWKATVYLKT